MRSVERLSEGALARSGRAHAAANALPSTNPTATPLILNADGAATALTKPCSRSAAANDPTMLNKCGGQHMGPEVTKWLDHKKRKRWHLHFIPTSSSWLNLVERWFKELTDKRLRRGRFTSVDELIDALEMWTEHWNDNPRPFVWTKTAEEIIAKVQRGRAALHQIKTATDH